MKFRALVACLTLMGLALNSRADDLQKMAPERSQLYAQLLSDQFEKDIQDRQVKFVVDAANASGLRSGQDGIIVVPARNLVEESNNAELLTPNGAALGYLFLSPCFTPIIDGKAVDMSKLRRLNLPDGREVICLLLTVKRTNGDDWRMYGFGNEKTPLVNSSFAQASDTAGSQISIQVTGAKDKVANLDVTVFGKFIASFKIATK